MVAADGESADRGKVLRQATRLLGGLSVMDLTAILPVLETYSMNGGAGTYSLSGEDLYFLSQAATDGSEINAPDVVDVGCYIYNNGNDDDRAEALLAILPIARGIHERDDEEVPADHSKA